VGYRLHRRETLAKGLKRVVTEQYDKALEELEDPEGDRDEAIHDARKCFKKTRAVLRMARDPLGPSVYRQENARVRDMSRALSSARDSAVAIGTLEDLRGRFGADLPEGGFLGIRQGLVARYEAASAEAAGGEDPTAAVAAQVRDARSAVPGWPLKGDGFDLIRSGFKRVYKRGRRALEPLGPDAADEAVHEWRKRVKYLWYHVRLLQASWPRVLDVLADALDDLSTWLGLDHDLAMLRALLHEDVALAPGPGERQEILALVARRQAELREQSLPLGRRVYAERPGAFADRLGAYWTTWREERG